MRGLDFTPRARRDIEEIWEYSADQFGLDRADLYLRDIQRAAMTVAERVEASPATRFVPAIASSPSARTILFFKASATRVVIVRILHRRMDFGRHIR
jgi:toxin ParE1/3/4